MAILYFFIHDAMSLLQPLHQILHPQMRVPCQHLKRFVPCDGSDLHRIKTLLEKATGGFVPEIDED